MGKVLVDYVCDANMLRVVSERVRQIEGNKKQVRPAFRVVVYAALCVSLWGGFSGGDGVWWFFAVGLGVMSALMTPQVTLWMVWRLSVRSMARQQLLGSRVQLMCSEEGCDLVTDPVGDGPQYTLRFQWDGVQEARRVEGGFRLSVVGMKRPLWLWEEHFVGARGFEAFVALLRAAVDEEVLVDLGSDAGFGGDHGEE